MKFKYVLENSHTWVKLSENSEKVKVVTGEIIEIDEKYQNKARLFVAGFRQVNDIEVEVKNDGKDEITIKVEKPSKKSK